MNHPSVFVKNLVCSFFISTALFAVSYSPGHAQSHSVQTLQTRSANKPPQLTTITGQQIEELIVKANNGDIAAQDELAKRYHWANFPQALLKKMDVKNWENVAERAKTNYELAYVLIMSHKIHDFPDLIESITLQAHQGNAPYQNLMGMIVPRRAFYKFLVDLNSYTKYLSPFLSFFDIFNKGVIEKFYDPSEYYKWFQKAADQGFAPAQLNVAYGYMVEGKNPVDLSKAFNLLEQAGQQNYPFAQYFVGLMYAKGKGVPQNQDKAIEWYKKSADQGFVLAQGDLGALYVERGNTAEGLDFLEKAASQMDVISCYRLRDIYSKGEIVPQDIEKVEYFSRIAGPYYDPYLDDERYNYNEGHLLFQAQERIFYTPWD